MADQSKHAARRTKFVAKIVGDPANPPKTKLLTGFLGDSSLEAHTRLYFDASLNDYAEIPDDAILHTEPRSPEESTLGGEYVWVEATAKLTYSAPNPHGSKAQFFDGPIYQEYDWAGTGGMNTGGYGNKVIGAPVRSLYCPSLHCPSAICKTQVCPTQVCVTQVCATQVCATQSCPTAACTAWPPNTTGCPFYPYPMPMMRGAQGPYPHGMGGYPDYAYDDGDDYGNKVIGGPVRSLNCPSVQCPSAVCRTQVCPSQVCITQVCRTQVCATETCPTAACTAWPPNTSGCPFYPYPMPM